MIAWLVRALSGSQSANVADQVVQVLGDRGLDRYLSAVEFTLPGKSAVASLLRTTLINLPRSEGVAVTAHAGQVGFLYQTSPSDALRFTCRRDFEDWEPVSRWFFALMATQSNVVLDIGAYSGVYAITAATANSHVHVTAFEPNPIMHNLACRNIAINRLDGAVSVLPIALSNASGVARLHLAPDDTSLASLVDIGESFIEVQLDTLDSIVGDVQVDLIKIDVEGSESAVFEGAQAMLAKWHPTILAEVLSSSDLDRQSEVLMGLGYGSPIPVDPTGAHGDARNVIWVAPNRRDRVSDVLHEARAGVAQWPKSRRSRRRFHKL